MRFKKRSDPWNYKTNWVTQVHHQHITNPTEPRTGKSFNRLVTDIRTLSHNTYASIRKTYRKTTPSAFRTGFARRILLELGKQHLPEKRPFSWTEVRRSSHFQSQMEIPPTGWRGKASKAFRALQSELSGWRSHWHIVGNSLQSYNIYMSH